MVVTRTGVLFLLAGILQSIAGKITREMVLEYDEDYGNHTISINGSVEDHFPYDDYYDANFTYDYTNGSGTDYRQNESLREKEMTLGDSAGVLLPCHWMLSFMTLLHFLYFLQEALCMSL